MAHKGCAERAGELFNLTSPISEKIPEEFRMMKSAYTALLATMIAAAAVPAQAGGHGGHGGGHGGPSIKLGAIVNTAAKINVLNIVKAKVGLGLGLGLGIGGR
jgi:hypothetical protein